MGSNAMGLFHTPFIVAKELMIVSRGMEGLRGRMGWALQANRPTGVIVPFSPHPSQQAPLRAGTSAFSISGRSAGCR
ncbi:hypothetical protein Msi02_44070 [Microbispora siamensis]|uniref:Uncharacterized protein n=1 Tax=Microbispora siamensis TaxID=564413 RepID=A0ABQ4GQ78_9ACTN|nr:hypothetical protein Msi02_44070 [Microbispora siamensis]